MWKSYVLFCDEQLHTQQALLTNREKLEAVRRIISVCSRAEAGGVSDEEISENWINALLNVGEVKQAVEVAKKATDAFPSSPRLWILRIRIVVRQKLIKGQIGNESGIYTHFFLVLFSFATFSFLFLLISFSPFPVLYLSSLSFSLFFSFVLFLFSSSFSFFPSFSFCLFLTFFPCLFFERCH